MKVRFQFRGLNITAGVRKHLREPLEHLQRLISITNAAVVLEHRLDSAPAYRAFVLLAVPGPDIHAEACDYTLTATWLKVTTALRKQIDRRKAKQLARVKSARERPIFIAPWSREGMPR